MHNIIPDKNYLSFPLRLNKYISYSGVCSRRKADELIESGQVSVNGKIIKEPGYTVNDRKQVVVVKGKKISPESKYVYIVFNKPKDCITTMDDEKGRKTVMDFISDDSLPRIFPVGRLDRNTTGVLLLTNDGNLSNLLTHPSSNIQKEYIARISPPLEKEKLLLFKKGIAVEDEIYKAFSATYVNDLEDTISITIHYGKYHIVRKMFEAIGHKVISLDRVDFAGINKKGLLKGHWRHLTTFELKKLKSRLQLNKH